jgi:hypothetical protein
MALSRSTASVSGSVAGTGMNLVGPHIVATPNPLACTGARSLSRW